MKKVLLTGAGILMFTLSAQAGVSPYVALKTTYVNPTSSTKLSDSDVKVKLDDDVAGVRAALGIGTKAPLGAFRTEIELLWNDKPEHSAHAYDAAGALLAREKVSLESQAVMLNAYYDFKTPTHFVPYVGAGIGLSHLKGKMSWTDAGETGRGKLSDEAFAWQVGVGVAYRFSCCLSVDLGYRFMDYGRINKKFDGDKIKASMKANEFSLGLRYYF